MDRIANGYMISLAAVNFFLGLVGIVQVGRILMYKQSQKGKSTVEEVKDEVKTAVSA
jgi:hypothetical protein